MSTGRDLEVAIAAAAKHYQAVDKCELAKQHTPRRFDNQHTAKAPVDFKGWYGPTRQPFYIEAKATSDGVIKFVPKDGDGIKENQLNAMRDAVSRGIHMMLVVDFVHENEVYVIDVKYVIAFADAPWRKSLPLFWCRAVGEIAKVSGTGGYRRVWFLDTHPHAGRDVAGLAVAADKARSNGAVVVLYPDEMKASKKLHERLATRPKPGTPEHAEYLIECANVGLRRAMGMRAYKPKQRKGWR